jgi:cytochrome c oxidase subunit 2
VKTRRTFNTTIIALAILLLITILLIVALPVLAQDGQPCADCPVSFDTPSILDPNSTSAAEISRLFWFVFSMAAAVFVLVESLLIFTIFRYRNRPLHEALQVHGNTRLEIMWTAIPALILVVLLGFTLRTMVAVRAPAKGEALKVTVIGHQWWWEFQYPELGIITANQLIVPVNQPVNVEIRSADVQHGFWAPQLFGKMDAVPGHTNRMNFTVTAEGNFGAQCTQMCGEQHAQMRFEIIGVSAAKFQTWAAAQQQAPTQPADEAAQRGQKVFADKGCIACHAINGNPLATGRVGPNLTHLWTRDFIAGGILPRTPETVRAWVHNAPSFKLGTVMPNFSDPSAANYIDDGSLNDLIAYLSTLQ